MDPTPTHSKSALPEPRSTSQPAPAPHEDLAYIRGAMDAAREFTAVPGKGLLAMGGVGLLATALSLFWIGAPWLHGRNESGLLWWLVALTLALAVGTSALLDKAHRMGHSLRSELLRKMLLGMLPGLFCGGLLTLAVVLYAAEWRLLAPVWLGCYGLAVLAGGQYSVLAVRLMGFAFMVLAAFSVAAPAAWGLLWLALGFGGVHLGFGAYIAWRYNG